MQRAWWEGNYKKKQTTTKKNCSRTGNLARKPRKIYNATGRPKTPSQDLRDPPRGRAVARTPSATCEEGKGSASLTWVQIARAWDVLTPWKALAELRDLSQDFLHPARLGWISDSNSRLSFARSALLGPGCQRSLLGVLGHASPAEEPACVPTMDEAAELLFYVNGRKVSAQVLRGQQGGAPARSPTCLQS